MVSQFPDQNPIFIDVGTDNGLDTLFFQRVQKGAVHGDRLFGIVCFTVVIVKISAGKTPSPAANCNMSWIKMSRHFYAPLKSSYHIEEHGYAIHFFVAKRLRPQMKRQLASNYVLYERSAPHDPVVGHGIFCEEQV
jgi:hypothetical protein